MHRHSDSLHKYFRKKLYIGYYLAQAIRRYPGQGFKDSHTPQVLKFQILLLALFLTTISTSVPLIGQFPNWRFYLSVGVAWLFLVTTIPFTLKALRKDRLVGLSSPCFLLVRALALGVGYTWGTIRPLPGISGEEDSIGGLTYVSKRAFDLLFGVLGLLLLGLVGPFIVLLIKVASAGPVFVSYERVGQGGRVFVAHRIRTGEVTCQPSRWFDAFLLRWRLDQLPLAWNLVKGDISLVGPGAETPVAVAQYEDWHRRRLSVKPGMTGPVQLRRDPQRISLDERTRLELSYIQEHSLGGDLRILIAAAKEIARNATGPTDDGIGC